MRPWLLLFWALLRPVVPQSAPDGWKTYENPALGFSFQYPGALELREHANPDPAAGPRFTVDLYRPDIDPGRPNLGRINVLRVAVWEHDAVYPAQANSYYEKQKDYRKISVGGRQAGQFVDCGRAACHWRIVIYGSREVWIFTGDPNEDAKSGPDDSRYPFHRIVDSFRFGPKFPK